MKKLIIMFSTVFVLIGLPVHAGFYNGNNLVPLMREYEKADRKDSTAIFVSAGNFMGYVTGVYDVLEASGIVCSVDGINRGQVFSVVVKYLNSNPKRWGEPAANLVLDALRTAFPCKKEGDKATNPIPSSHISHNLFLSLFYAHHNKHNTSS
jgi:hypothetical protein